MKINRAVLELIREWEFLSEGADRIAASIEQHKRGIVDEQIKHAEVCAQIVAIEEQLTLLDARQ